VQVNYRESITQPATYEYTHKKQTGGAGQYGKVAGRIEPLPEGSNAKLDFVNLLSGNDIPSQYVTSIEKGFLEAMASGQLTGHPVEVHCCHSAMQNVLFAEKLSWRV
jgi:elongation factor G